MKIENKKIKMVPPEIVREGKSNAEAKVAEGKKMKIRRRMRRGKMRRGKRRRGKRRRGKRRRRKRTSWKRREEDGRGYGGEKTKEAGGNANPDFRGVMTAQIINRVFFSSFSESLIFLVQIGFDKEP